MAAQYQCDKHVVKMILESCQMLSTAHRELDNATDPILYKSTHKNHPSNIWVRADIMNYYWLWHHTVWLAKEYTFRYGKIHKCERDGLIEYLRASPKNIPRGVENLRPPQCMPDKYKRPDTIAAYRAYYCGEKAGFAKWSGRPVPDWFKPTDTLNT